MVRSPQPRARTPNPDATPQCRHFGTCGGCSQLDQPIAWQLHHKVEASERLLAPFLGEVRIAHDVPSRPPRHFRTRLLYPVREAADGRAISGIYEFKTHRVVRIDECQTQDPWLTELGRAMEHVVREQRLPPFVPGPDRGYVKGIQARLAGGTGEVVAGLITRPGAFPGGREFAAAVQRAAEAIPRGRFAKRLVGVVHSISDRDDEFLLGDRHVPLLGRDHVVDRRDDLTFRVSAGSFYQVHGGAHLLLYAPAIAMCGDVRGLHVVDGYGGVGCFGLRFAKAGAASVTIVEEGTAACRDAEHNSRANRSANVTVVVSPFATAPLPDRPDLLVVDPPRAGLGEGGVVRALASRPQRLLYVSCAADSLARDLAVLTASGYRVTAARLCDLFPHTEHVELVVLLAAS